jgi:ubiquitin carboxyl-terminal hydrolase 8
MTDSKVRELAYGGRSRQHDSAEFLNFLLEILDDELNPKRDQPAPNTSSPEYERTVNELPIAKASAHVWETWVSGEDSPITRKMKGQIGHITTCDECRKESRTFDTFTYLTLNILKTNTQSVEDMIRREWNNVTTISNYSCDHCKRKDVSASRVDYLCWLPDYLILQISRYNNSLDKIQTSVTFPEKGLDLEPAFLPRNTDDPLSTDHRRKRPFLYDCYAAILHQGYQISSGHYWTVAKSTDKYGQQAGDWQKFNDSLVAKTTFAELQSRNTTVIFLKRQGAPDF